MFSVQLTDTSGTGARDQSSFDSGVARSNLLGVALVVAATILFVAAASKALPKALEALAGQGNGPNSLLACALALNTALLLFTWRRYQAMADEVKFQRDAEALARKLADTDALTGCLNRRSIGSAATQLMADAKARGRGIAALMIDIDNFKQINDANGHQAGDAILREAAERLGAILPHDSLLARLGGDEFTCILVHDPMAPDRIDQLTATIIDAVARPFFHGEQALETTVSVGIAASSPDDPALDAQRVMHMADIAMYHAKKHGRNCYYWFEPAMESELRFRVELERGIRRGIERGEFVPFYEKQIDVKTGELLGFEMLARWQSPSLGLVGPDIFIPIAEEIGVIAALSESVIAQALHDARDWNPRLTLSVNISPIQLRDPWFAQKLLKMLVEANFPPSRLEVEITESCLHENIGLVRSLVTSLKNQGIRISLDDFGTGYSSLAQLRSLPFDRIKIDRSFVTSLPENKESATIVQAITSLGEGLGLPITAEGIETEEVLAELRRYGSYKGQGYLYGMPMPADATNSELAQLKLLASAAPTAGQPAATIGKPAATAAEDPDHPLASNG